jgi:hypothetical protein
VAKPSARAEELFISSRRLDGRHPRGKALNQDLKSFKAGLASLGNKKGVCLMKNLAQLKRLDENNPEKP